MSQSRRMPGRYALLVCGTLLLIGSSATIAGAQEGEWIELPTLNSAETGEVIDPFTADVADPPADDDPAAAPADEAAGDDDWRTVLPDSSATAGTWDTAAGYAGGDQPRQPPLDLPRRFIWNGKSEALGRVGYVYLGDHYFVEESDYDAAEIAYRYALAAWPECRPVQLRLDLLQVFRGDWLLTAENLQVAFDGEAPSGVNHEYGINEDSPILSDRAEDVPEVPAILYRLCLGALNQDHGCTQYDPARDFLAGRLLAFVGDFERAIERLGPVAMDDHAEPWNYQAASQRASLYLRTWRPELAFTNLLRARALVGEDARLVQRLDGLERALALNAGRGDGREERVTVKILGCQEQGRWVLDSPRRDFTGSVRIRQGDGGDEARTHLLYRGEDYWLMTVPLGQQKPDWEVGSRVTLIGQVASR